MQARTGSAHSAQKRAKAHFSRCPRVHDEFLYSPLQSACNISHPEKGLCRLSPKILSMHLHPVHFGYQATFEV